MIPFFVLTGTKSLATDLMDLKDEKLSHGSIGSNGSLKDKTKDEKRSHRLTQINADFKG